MPIELGGALPEPREVFFTEPTPRSDRPPVRTEALAGWGGPVPEQAQPRDQVRETANPQERAPLVDADPASERGFDLPDAPDLPDAFDPRDSPDRVDVAEQFAGDLAEPSIRAAIWEGLAAVAQVLRPGAEVELRQTGEAARWFPGIPSADCDDAMHPRVPVISDDSGLALGWRVRPGRTIQPPGEPSSGEPSPGETYAGGTPAGTPRLRGVWPFDPPRSAGAGASGAAVVAPRVEIRAETERYEVSADALVEYVRDRSRSVAADPGQAVPKVIVYGDPDTGVGLVALQPVDAPAYAPVCFRVELDGAEPRTRFWGAPRTDGWTTRLPRPRQSDGPVLGSRTARAEVTRAATNWPQLLEELADRFASDLSTLVKTAIAGAVVTPVVARALNRFGPGAADTLSEVGAGGAAFLLARVAPLLPADYQERAVRYAVEEVVRWSLESGSTAAVRCRCHLAHLLGTSDVVGEVLDGAHRDLDRAGASALLRVVAPALLTSAVPDGRPDSDGGEQRRDAVLEFVFEQLESLAREPGALHTALAGLLRDTV